MRASLILLSALWTLGGLSLTGCVGATTGEQDAGGVVTFPDAGADGAAGPVGVDRQDPGEPDGSVLEPDGPGPGEDGGVDPEDAGGGPDPLDAGAPPDALTETDAEVPVDAEPPPPGATTVERNYRVLHWNIAGGKENDCRPAEITRAVRRFVRDHRIHFVGLNEVCPAQFDAIREALRAEWGLAADVRFAAYVGDATPRIVGNAIYSRFGLENVTRLQVGQDQYGNRNLLCGRVPELPHVRFCSTHLTPGDATARVQLGRVLDQIEQWWTERRDTVILSGDLNLRANDPGLDRVYSAAANTGNNPDNRGRYREADDADPDHCPGYGEGSLPGTAGGPCGQGGKIDFIFVRENRIVDGDYGGDTFAIPTDCTGVCSDHRAVFGRFRVRVRVD